MGSWGWIRFLSFSQSPSFLAHHSFPTNQSVNKIMEEIGAPRARWPARSYDGKLQEMAICKETRAPNLVDKDFQTRSLRKGEARVGGGQWDDVRPQGED